MGQAEIDSVDVAKALMAEADSQGLRLNMTQLQKLLYIVYGTCLVMLGRRPFDEHAQAWPFGPVFPKTRRRLLNAVKNWNIEDCPATVPDDVKGIVHKVVRFFGSWTSGQLIEWTHVPGSPWDMTQKMPGFKWANEIGDGLITDYFKAKVIRRRANASG